MSALQGEINALQESLKFKAEALDTSYDQARKHIERLYDYECWLPLIELVDCVVQSKISEEKRTDLVCMKISILLHRMNASDQAKKIAMDFISSSSIGFNAFKLQILDNLMLDPIDKVEFIEGIANAFQKYDKIKASEYVCLLSETKIFDEKITRKALANISSLDPENITVLQHKKLQYSSQGQWKDVAQILNALIRCGTNEKEIVLYAKELANLYFYFIDDKEKALHICKQYTDRLVPGFLDLQFQICNDLQKWVECKDLLEKLLEKVENATEKAICHYRLSHFSSRLTNFDAQIQHLKSCLHFNPRFFQAYEELIQIYVARKKWDELMKTLTQLLHVVQGEFHVNRLKNLIDRLDDGIQAYSA